MKETTSLKQANIDNLTSLWKTVGSSFNAYSKMSGFEYCEIQNAEWPNRVWFNQNITQQTVDSLKEKIAASTSKITLPVWNIEHQKEASILERNGFKATFEQVGMLLKIQSRFETEGHVKIQRVANETEAKLWAELFKKSFGYIISHETVSKTYKDINFYIAYHDHVAVGTALLHKTDRILGVHSVGIPPEMRRRGYAEQIMKLLINLAVENQYEYITLQASSMGKHLYLKLGFEEQFLIRNYTLKHYT
ncbi:GNAT family N-acetyltransferase [Limibacter armeniacum]|uniref:GNAT family N-acetyltransferase n=1 Tax=Limibacter armeniacum TaxID=466084 RepID=UPI002FE6489A